jgi:hypothetical protein
MVLLLAALLSAAQFTSTPFTKLDAKLSPFTQQFNNYADRTRLVMLVSPT